MSRNVVVHAGIRAATMFVCVVATAAVVWRMLGPTPPYNLSTAALLSAAAIASFGWLRFEVSAPRSERAAIAVLVTVGALLRVLSVVLIPNEQVSDFQIYHELAVALSAGKGFAYSGATGLAEDVPLYLNREPVVPLVPTAFRPPGAPLALAAVYTLVGVHPLAGKLTNALVGVAGGLCLYWLLCIQDAGLAFRATLLWLV